MERRGNLPPPAGLRHPAEVENALMKHPAIQDVAVIGIPDDRWGEVPLAIVVRKAGYRRIPLCLCNQRLRCRTSRCESTWRSLRAYSSSPSSPASSG
ncbi:MAG: hypothetical protein EBW98_03345 [Actinobacteria bacterium]|nr:hypothetical protein [Actinomycetota bacterium]